MGLYDRDYYREKRGGFASLSGVSVNTWIIIVNVAIFAFMAMSPRFAMFAVEHGHFSTYEVLWHRNPNGTAGGLEFWRFLTFQFLHAGPMHLAFNMFGLYIFGGMVEEHLGRKKYLAFYLTCGIFGGLMYLLLNLAGNVLGHMGVSGVPGLLFSDPRTPLVGASAGVFGVIMACAYIAPTLQVLAFFVFPMRLKTMAYLYVGMALVSLLMGARNAGGEAAHLGGAIAGAFFVRNSHLLRDFFDVLKDSRKVRHANTPQRARGPVSGAERDPHEAEVDRILAKVHREGIHSLTEAEKATLARDTESKRFGR
jgi:membrane associated rhomboid family serine protease